MQSEEMSFQFALERGHCTIVGPEQRAVENEMCRCDGPGGVRRPEVAERRGLAGV